MGLSRLSPQRAADGGAWLTLVDPATKKDLWLLGQPARIKVLGRDSTRVQEELQVLLRRQRDGDPEVDSEFVGRRLVEIAIIGWSDNLHVEEPGDLPYNPENAHLLVTDDRTSWVVEQIGPFSMKRLEFLANRPPFS